MVGIVPFLLNGPLSTAPEAQAAVPDDISYNVVIAACDELKATELFVFCLRAKLWKSPRLDPVQYNYIQLYILLCLYLHLIDL